MTSIYLEQYQLVIHTLKEARIKQNITQEKLAQALNRPQSFIAKIESRERRLDVVEFVHIARLLSLNPEAVIKKIK